MDTSQGFKLKMLSVLTNLKVPCTNETICGLKEPQSRDMDVGKINHKQLEAKRRKAN